jgi:hypothetical protein
LDWQIVFDLDSGHNAPHLLMQGLSFTKEAASMLSLEIYKGTCAMIDKVHEDYQRSAIRVLDTVAEHYHKLRELRVAFHGRDYVRNYWIANGWEFDPVEHAAFKSMRLGPLRNN